MENFDLIIIGGGAGAFAAAIRANELGAKTALVNAGLPLGGTCVNVGCVPSKTLLWAGEVMHQAKHHGIPGINIEVKSFDFQTVVQDELNLVEKLRTEKYEKVLVTDRYDQPYILFLFYLQYPIDKFQYAHELLGRDRFGFSTVPNFDKQSLKDEVTSYKYEFRSINWDIDQPQNPNSLIVGTPEEIPDEANIVKEIYGSNGYKYFEVVTL